MRAFLPKVLVSLVFVAAAVSCAWRLQHGVNLSDEALHVSIPLRFALGARPFIDELSSVQTYGLITWPLASLYMAWNGSTEAIVAYFRLVFASLWVVLSLAYWLLTKRYSDTRLATLVAAAPLVCIPSNIPSLSYISLGMFAFSFLALVNLGLLSNHRRLKSLAIGSTTMLGAFAYPPALPALAYLAARCARHGADPLLILISSLVVCAPAVSILNLPEIYHSSPALEYVRGGYASSSPVWWRILPLASPLVVVVSAAAIRFAQRISYGLVLPLAVAGAYLASPPNIAAYAIQSNMLLVLIALLLVAEIPPNPPSMRKLTPLASTLLATLVAYAGTSCFSSYPATCSILWFGPLLAVLVLRNYQRLAPEKELLTLTYCALTLCLAWCVTLRGRYTWEESHITTQVARVSTGPYAYLKTSLHRHVFLTSFEREISPLISSGTSLVGWGVVAPSFLSLYYPSHYGLATAYPDRHQSRQTILSQRLISAPHNRVVALRTSFTNQPRCADLPLDQLLCAGKSPLMTSVDQHLVMSWWIFEKPEPQDLALKQDVTNVDRWTMHIRHSHLQRLSTPLLAHFGTRGVQSDHAPTGGYSHRR